MDMEKGLMGKQDGYEYGQKVEGGVEEGGWKLERREEGGGTTHRDTVRHGVKRAI